MNDTLSEPPSYWRPRASLRAIIHPLVALTTRRWDAEPRLIQQAQLPIGATVLDLLCGTGSLAVELKAGNPDIRVIGVDRSERRVARARRRAERAGVAVDFRELRHEPLPFPDASFDRVVSSFALHALPERERPGLLAEARRVLRPGGELHAVGVVRSLVYRDSDWIDAAREFPHEVDLDQDLDRSLQARLALVGFEAIREHGTLPLPDGTLVFLSARRSVAH